jgi:hypothetical protein
MSLQKYLNMSFHAKLDGVRQFRGLGVDGKIMLLSELCCYNVTDLNLLVMKVEGRSFVTKCANRGILFILLWTARVIDP